MRETPTHQADRLHERLARDVVLLHADDGRRRVRSRGEDRLDRVDALQRGLASQTGHLPTTNEDPVIGARSTAALGVTERGDARVEAETLGQDVLDLRRGNGLEVLVKGALGNDDDGLALADLAVLRRSAQRFELRRTFSSTSHISARQSSVSGGRSGTKTKSAPVL